MSLPSIDILQSQVTPDENCLNRGGGSFIVRVSDVLDGAFSGHKFRQGLSDQFFKLEFNPSESGHLATDS